MFARPEVSTQNAFVFHERPLALIDLFWNTLLAPNRFKLQLKMV